MTTQEIDDTAAVDPYTSAGVSPGSGQVAGEPGAVVVMGPHESPSIDPPPAVGPRSELGTGDFLDKDPYLGALRRQHISELKDRAGKRHTMMKWTLKAGGFVIAGSWAAMAAYVVSQWNNLDPAVMTGWFVSVVAEVIGIVYVVASYLFPKDDHHMEAIIQSHDGGS
ncbi:hypothetical protein [Pseudarthrobacter sp. ATCC 49987]|uniref:hypothetical protein n=1 Tax=Pseudarthrobacter sp. ATCC 49987 TaxID=2698204 RepID=UPI00136E39AD|nr:hypothetical protein [Pseudarthrobacter sp. ATCC 49987]